MSDLSNSKQNEYRKKVKERIDALIGADFHLTAVDEREDKISISFTSGEISKEQKEIVKEISRDFIKNRD